MSQFMNQGNSPFDNVQFGMDYGNNQNANPFQSSNTQFMENQSQPQNTQYYQNQNSQYYQQQSHQNYQPQNNYNNNGYNAEKDKILYEVRDQLISGKNNQNQFTMRIRSYNNTSPKIELVKTTIGNNGQPYNKSIRLSREEFEFIINHATEIGQMLLQLINSQAPKQY